MSKVLAIVSLENGALPDTAAELAAVGRAVSGGDAVEALVLGSEVGAAADELSRLFAGVLSVDDGRLAVPDGELFADIAEAILNRLQPAVAVMAHTNLAMDIAPRLSAVLDRPLVTDCLSASVEGDRLVAVRSMYAGKVHAKVEVPLSGGCIVTVRPGAVAPADPAAAQGNVQSEPLPAKISARRRFVRTVDAGAGDVDISQSEVLVAVGRGIEDGDNMGLIEELAAALGGEIACSRPVVDSGWLPKSRQVGTSGVSVKPKLYLTVGISGSFQHMGGVKGNPYIVAINSDPRAPIFGDADVGVVGDLFEIVPALTRKIKGQS